MTDEAPAMTGAVPVLCIYRAYTVFAKTGLKDWFDGAKMIHVVRSADILPEFDAVMAEMRRMWVPMSLLQRNDGWELVSYRPYNGLAHF